MIIKFKYKTINIGKSGLKDYWDLLLDIGSDFFIYADDDIFFQEIDFCVVEFAAQLYSWTEESSVHECFKYSSVEYEEPFIIQIYNKNDRWFLDSCFSEFQKPIPIILEQVQAEAKRFVDDLQNSLLAIGVDIAPLLQKHRRHTSR